MADHLKTSESVRTGLRRIGGAALDAMRADLEADSGGPHVHEVRKRSKLLRAVLRLARGSLPNVVRSRENQRLRRVAQSLGVARDAEVRLETFRHLIARTRHRQSHAFQKLESQLRKDISRSRRAFSPELLARADASLTRARKAWAELPLHRHGWQLLEPGLRASYRHARRCWRAAAKAPSDAALHEWRRRVKNLWYQAGILRDLCPQKLEPVVEGLDKLGQTLGLDHDLAVLRTYSIDHMHDATALDALIARRRCRLQHTAFQLAVDLFDAKPGAFTRRFERWWHHWRS